MTEFIWRLTIFTGLLAYGAQAQTGNAAISGHVTDVSGGSIVGASVSVKNNQTNVVRNTTTNAEGRFSVTNLIPGVYTLNAQFQGFKNLERDNIVLRVGDHVGLDLELEVGAAAERVTVTAELPLLRTEDVQSGLVIDNRRIQELPQYNRNALAFALLTPNVNGLSEQAGYSNDLRINGGRTAQAEYFIDGVPVTTGYQHNVPQAVPSREAIGEFKVLTNGLSAEYGRLSGGAVVLVTRSGTNEYHGSLYEFFRNDKLNANDWNSNRFGRRKGIFHDNVFGATFGGPVRIPKLYNGRDRTFFFFNYEGTRRSTGSNAVTGSVPSMLERQGDFSQSLIDRGNPVQIFDPLTGRYDGSNVVREPFPGNRVPESRFDPLAKIYLGFYPEPNRPPQPNSSHDQNFIGSVTNPSSNDRWTGRLDQNWNSSNTTHFTLTRFDSKSTSPRWLSQLQAASLSYSTQHTFGLDHTITLTPTTILNMRGGAVRLWSFTGSEVVADASNWGLQPEVVNLLGTAVNRVPNMATGDTITALGGGSVNAPIETNYSGAVSIQKLWGKHSFKAGYEHRRYYANVLQGGSFSVATDRFVTSRLFNPPTTGSGFASWLLGSVTWGTGQQLAGPASLQTYHGVYFQDDIKFTSKLTVNAGLRWDFEPSRTERFDRQIYWDKDYKWNWTPNPGWSWDLVQQQAGANVAPPEWLTNGFYGRVAMLGTKEYPGRHSQATLTDHFGPRVGLAYQVLPKTVLRAGYGLVWLTTTGGSFLNGAPWNIGYGDFARLAQTGTPDGGLTFPLSFKQPMPGGAGYVPFTRDVEALNRSTLGQWFIANAWEQSPGYEHVVQFSLQREVGAGPSAWVFELAYNGNFGRSFPFWVGRGEHIMPDAYHKLGPLDSKLLNPVSNPFYGQIPLNTTQGGATLPFGRMFQLNPIWNEIWTMGEPLGMSNYNSGYFQAEHRFGNGFAFLANYTISKMLQDVGGIDNQFAQGPSQHGFPQAGLPMSDIYGIAPTDMTHKLLFNYLFELPIGRGKKLLANPDSTAAKVLDQVVGGWQMAGTTTFYSGQALIVGCPYPFCSQWYNIGQARRLRPRLVLPRVPYDNQVDGHTSLEGAAGFVPYLNPASFRPTEGFEIGDVGSVLPDKRGPGLSQWDFSLMKRIGLGAESRFMQLRFEAQNLFNHMNAANPNGEITQRTFGMITGQRGSPRQIMLAAKLYF